MANYRHYGPGTPRLEGPTPKDYQDGSTEGKKVAEMEDKMVDDRVMMAGAECPACHEINNHKPRCMVLYVEAKAQEKIEALQARIAELEGKMNYEGADMELREKDDRIAELQARIAELRAERERVKMLAKAEWRRFRHMRTSCICAWCKLLAATSPEEK